jgi:hypothetical protein
MTTRRRGSTTIRFDARRFTERARRAALVSAERGLVDAAQATVDYARSRWPVGPPEGGHSRDQFFVRPDVDGAVVAVVVGNDAPYAADIVSDGVNPWLRYVVGPSLVNRRPLADQLARLAAEEMADG